MIKLSHVTKKYGSIMALDDFSLEIPEGELYVLLGPSGCGKSTTIRLINGLIQPDDGQISIKEKHITDLNMEKARKKMGYVIQSIGLFPHYNVKENIGVVPKLLKWKKEDIQKRTIEMLELVGLNQDYMRKYPYELSGGESQRIGVARALAANPDIVLMDEPFGSVDPLQRIKLQKSFYEIQKKLKKTVLFVTHDVEEAIRLADQIVVLKNGKKMDMGTPLDFLNNKKNEFVREFLGSEYILKLLSKHIIADYSNKENNSQELPTISYNDSLSAALSIMLSNGVDTLNVLDTNKKVMGQISFKEIGQKLMGVVNV